YADDTLLFVNGGKNSPRRTAALPKEYQKGSGQCINKGKSSFFCSEKAPASKIRAIATLLNINKSTGPLIYLGVPLSMGRLRSSA
ncbi:hypothetical protein PJP08_29405, partial [Mycobacterium kansasii]